MYGPLDSILTDNSLLAIIGKLSLIAQILLVIHVFKTGRPYWWFWVIMCFPVVGSIIYLAVEVLPEVRYAGADGPLALFQTRAGRIRALREALEETDTVKNRMALATELCSAGDTEEAYQVIVDCVKGPFRDDPHLLTEVARIQVQREQWKNALDLLSRVDAGRDKVFRMQVDLLKGNALLGSDKLQEAETIFRNLMESYLGDEPRYRLAVILKRTGHRSEAIALWKEIRKKYRKATPSWRRTEKNWFKLAALELKKAKA
jgi:hypothetical protein